jgi:hypothetical protein
LTNAPSPIDSARPACCKYGTSTTLSNPCVSTSTTTAIFTGVRMSWLA